MKLIFVLSWQNVLFGYMQWFNSEFIGGKIRFAHFSAHNKVCK